MLTNGSLQGVTILKDKILEDNTGVASHPDLVKLSKRDSFTGISLFRRMVKKLCLCIKVTEAEDEEFRVIHTMQLSPERLYFGVD